MYYTAKAFGIQYDRAETIIKLRIWVKHEVDFWPTQRRIEQMNLPIKALPWPKGGFSKVPGVDITQYFGFTDIVPSVSGKERAIMALFPEVPERDIITIGDDYNDSDMLKAFYGYAIAGSPAEVVEAAQGRTISSVKVLIHHLLHTRR